MQKISTLVAILFLSGCSFLPKPHDSVLAGKFVDTKLAVNDLQCEIKDNFLQVFFQQSQWRNALENSTYLKEYTSFRGDPQAQSAAALKDDIQKAFDTDKKIICNHWLTLAKTRLTNLEIDFKDR